MDYTYRIETSKMADELFAIVLDVRKWWTGLFAESIEGNSAAIGDEFSFSAGGGVHYSKQKLVELIPNKKVVWLVTESNLQFLEKPDEWNKTQISFEIEAHATGATLRFSHLGLQPQIECYDSCSSAWTQYLHRLEKAVN